MQLVKPGNTVHTNLHASFVCKSAEASSSRPPDIALRALLSSLSAPAVSQVGAREATAEWSAPVANAAPVPKEGEVAAAADVASSVAASSAAATPTVPPPAPSLEEVSYELLLSEKGQDRPARLLKWSVGWITQPCLRVCVLEFLVKAVCG